MTRGPGRLSLCLIELAVQGMPFLVGYRYRREFTAELHALPPSRRLGFAVRVLIHSRALRAEAEAAARGRAGTGVPLHCRLHLTHAFQVVHLPDGAYVACRDCGRPAQNTIFDSVLPRT